MLKISFITSSQEEIVVEGEVGNSLMEVAVNNGIEGIDAECGGACSCATCHVHIAPEWMGKVGHPNEHETDMLSIEEQTTDYSRLSCQIALTDDMDGIQVSVVDR